MFKKIIISTILTLSLLPMKAFAQPFSPLEAGFSAKSLVILDEQTNQIIAGNNADQVIPTASMMKLLDVLTAQQNKVNWNKVVKVEKADQVGGGMLSVKLGAKYKCIDLLHAALIMSANNAAHALWKCTNLSYDAFLEKANLYAQSLGTSNTVMVEPSGLDANNVTTARDFVKIASVALKDPLISSVLKKSSYSFTSASKPARKHTVKTTNALLGDGDFISLTGKTGYIEESGYNFAGRIVHKDNKSYVFVVMGNPTRQDQIQNTKLLAIWTSAQ